MNNLWACSTVFEFTGEQLVAGVSSPIPNPWVKPLTRKCVRVGSEPSEFSVRAVMSIGVGCGLVCCMWLWGLSSVVVGVGIAWWSTVVAATVGWVCMVCCFAVKPLLVVCTSLSCTTDIEFVGILALHAEFTSHPRVLKAKHCPLLICMPSLWRGVYFQCGVWMFVGFEGETVGEGHVSVTHEHRLVSLSLRKVSSYWCQL